MFRLIATVIALVIAATGYAAESDQIAQARRLFQNYVQLSQAFDVEVAELYADEANIKNKRIYPDGQVRELTMPAPRYKELVRTAMPLAKTRGDRNTYSDLQFTTEGKGVRITGTRFSELKQYASPVSLLVQPSSAGTWLIVEEITESRP